VTFADRLKEVMLERNPPLTQDALADRVGVTGSAVNGWLHGTIPYPRTLNKICLSLGIRRDWLLHGDGEKNLAKLDETKLQEMPPSYSRRDKITFIEEQAPELLPLVDAFLESVHKQLGAGHAGKRSRRTRQSSR
jgi:transcriptional regulator with XRE-family HTH domain